jgi:hypothetical protein
VKIRLVNIVDKLLLTGNMQNIEGGYKLKILRIYLWVIWTFAGLVNMGALVKKEDIDDRLIALISLVFMILPTLFYILNS